MSTFSRLVSVVRQWMLSGAGSVTRRFAGISAPAVRGKAIDAVIGAVLAASEAGAQLALSNAAKPHRGRGRKPPRKRATGRLGLMLAPVVAAGSLLTFGAAAAAADSCSNAAIRAQQTSAFLPDCRGYELVTPADKADGEFSTASLGADVTQAAPDGHAVAYPALLPFPGGTSGSPGYYVASRTAGGWSTSRDLIPPQATNNQISASPEVNGFSADLSKFTLTDGCGCGDGQDDPPLVPGEPPNNPNLFLGDVATGAWQLMDTMPSGAGAVFEGASPDYSHIVFMDSAALTPDAISGVDNVYEWVDGSISLVDLVPPAGASSCGAGGPACAASPAGAETGAGPDASVKGAQLNVVSADGSKVFFTTGNNEIFVRENGSSTAEVSASQKTNGSGPGGTDPNGPLPKTFAWATPDGSVVFFTSCEQLTNDSTAACFGFQGGGAELYRYDVATGTLTDVSVDHNGDPHGSDVWGVLGASSDGSYVYFVANGVLAPGASLGDCTGAGGPDRVGSCNLYVWHAGATTFIGQLQAGNSSDTVAGDLGDWEYAGTSNVTPDGRYLAFDSVNSLTGYDNTISDGGSSCGLDLNGNPTGDPRCSEVFLYDAVTNRLVCASCNPSGAQPLGPSSIPASGGTPVPFYDKHVLSDDGSRLFFQSDDALAAQDSNARQDVYEYEDGGPQLISSATASSDSTLLDTSADGSDVFFATDQQLVGQDTDSAIDIYDARVGGGFPAPVVTPAPCMGDACRGPVSGGPPPPVAATVTFAGPGDASPPPVGRVRVLTRVVHGSSFLVRVSVSGSGRITVSGAGIKTVRRTVGKRGTYALKVTLTAKQKRALKHKRKLKLRLRVAYAPAGGAAAAASVSLNVEQPGGRPRRSKARRENGDLRGAR